MTQDNDRILILITDTNLDILCGSMKWFADGTPWIYSSLRVWSVSKQAQGNVHPVLAATCTKE